ncbi:MAG: hypothetical protein LUG57_08775, partial [Oscillospiraceae bacterium]|nr:hypothetical protein [Oscillospiraceae bacterium]
LSVGAFASGEASGEASAETASAEAAEETAAITLPETSINVDVSQLTASEYGTLTDYTSRDDTGNIYIGTDVTEADTEVVLDETVTGAGYTAVYVHGEDASATVTGVEVATDDTDGQLASDFTGQGAAFVAYDSATLTIEDAYVYTEGFERTGIIVSENSSVIVKDSTFITMGADPLTEAYDEYVNSANQDIMLSPPWCLGIQGGARVVNMIGATPTLTVLNSTMVAGGWALLSTDSGSDMVINVVDSDLSIVSESEGGMDSGWRIFGYDEDAYGSGYGAYYIGNPSQYYYGTTISGVTYAAIITGATTGVYTSSNGDIDLYDANGELIETVEGEGNVTTINAVYGFMQHNSLSDGIYVTDGTVINVEEAVVLNKAADGDYYFDEAELNSASGILIQMEDNDDDNRIGMISMAEGFNTLYDESNVGAEDGFPGINYDYTSTSGGNTVTATFTNGDYVGDIFNGTGYYTQTGDDLVVTIGEGATLTGDIALTSTIKGIAYSEEAIEGIAYYGDDITYVLLDADGNVTEDESEAAYIQFKTYTINEYFLQGHVMNKVYYNGTSTASVVVEADGVWVVEEESLLTSLTIEEGATVYGTLTENADGTLTLTASDEVVEAGTYGTIEAVGGGTNVGGGVTDDGTLDVEAAAAALDASATASGEASGEASGN